MVFTEITEGWAFHLQPEGSEFKWMARHADTAIVGFGITKVAAARNLSDQVMPTEGNA